MQFFKNNNKMSQKLRHINYLKIYHSCTIEYQTKIGFKTDPEFAKGDR